MPILDRNTPFDAFVELDHVQVFRDLSLLLVLFIAYWKVYFIYLLRVILGELL